MFNKLKQNNMKTIKRLSLVFALIVAATVSSCGGSDEEEAPVVAIPATGSYINATADGAPFTTVVLGQSTANAFSTGTGAGRLITVAGSTVDLANPTNSKTILVSLLGINATGTYTVNQNSDSVLAYSVGTGSSMVAYSTGECSGATGTITVTSISATKVEGTFTFTGKNDGCGTSKSVTAGSFRGMFN
jgi:hypothetical protein